MKFPFGWPNFRTFAVSFREGILSHGYFVGTQIFLDLIPTLDPGRLVAKRKDPPPWRASKKKTDPVTVNDGEQKQIYSISGMLPVITLPLLLAGGLPQSMSHVYD